MIKELNHVTILVKEYDEALRFYTEVLGLEKRMDAQFGPARWVTVAPKCGNGLEIILQKPEPSMHGETGAKAMAERVGQNTTWVFGTADCRKTYEELRTKGVTFSKPPEDMPWGVQAVFQDLYGNSFALVQSRN